MIHSCAGSAVFGMLVLVLAFAGVSHAGIQYDPESDTILVTDYTEQMPCSLARIRKCDELFGWGRVAYDEISDTTTVSAQFVIGSNDGTHTCFQVGSPEHPREKLVIRKDLFVAPHWVKGVNPGKSWWQDAPKDIVNRLTLGVEGNEAVQATLIAGGGKLHVGRAPGMGNVERLGGQMFVFHSMITAANPPRPQPFKKLNKGTGMDFAGAGYVMDHALISGFSGFMTYGLQHGPKRTRFARLTNTVFENGGGALVNGEQRAAGCIFRNLTVAVMDYGSLNAVLTDCVFTGNQHNWALTYSKKGLTLIDCTFDEPPDGDIYRCWKRPKTRKTQYPVLAVKRHIVVSVASPDGKPVKDAVVTVRCEQGVFEAVGNARQITGNDGRTPGKGSAKALLLTEYIKRATDTPNQPETSEYTYTITAKADGFSGAAITGFKPRNSWAEVKVVITP